MDAPKRCDVGSTRGATKKPDQSGATSRMWIDGARSQTVEQPLVNTENIPREDL